MRLRRAVTVFTIAAALAVAAGAVTVLSAGPTAAQPDPGDWPAFLYDTGHTSYNAGATAITPSDVSSLVQDWRWPTPASPNDGPNTLWASPTVSGGVIYIGAEDGYFYAVSEASHSVLWSDFLALDEPKGTMPCGTRGQGIVSTATVANDPVTGDPTVFVNAPDGYLYALDAATGAVDWKGLVDTPSATVNDYYSWGSPLVANGKVYIGISSDCDAPLVPGGLVAFDQSTGAQVAQWIDVPPGSTNNGGSVWSSPVLLANGDIGVTTGNGYKKSGEPLYDDSVVALNPDTLAVDDHWQVPVSQQINDGDFGASPTTWTATINGTPTPMIGACDKNGQYYALAQDNLSAGPVWQATITVPYPGGAKECASAADYDGSELIIGGGAATTINGVTYPGSVQALDPATGAPLWQTGLQGTIVGTPTEDGGGVVAAQTFSSSDKQLGVYLLNAATGAVIGFIKAGMQLFGQAVFAGSDLLVGAGGSFGLQAFAAATAGPPITNVSPPVIGPGTTTKVTLTGSGFSASPSVLISNSSGISVRSVTVTSPTTIVASIYVGTSASPGPRDVTVVEPGPVTDSCTSCLTIGTPPPPPVPTSITPGSFAPGTSNTAATVQGSGFASGATVTSHAGIKFPSVTFVSSGQLNVSVTVASTVTPGTYNLFVHNPNGSSGECQGCLTVS